MTISFDKKSNTAKSFLQNVILQKVLTF